MADETCPAPLSDFDYILGVCLFVGTILSFLPQHIKLISKKSHLGLSIFKGAIGSTTSTCTVLYYASLEYNNTFYCCTNKSQCFSNLLPFLQLIAILVCDQFIMVLYIAYFDKPGLKKLGFDGDIVWNETRWVFTGAISFQIILLILFISFTTSLGFESDVTNVFGQILIVFSSIGQLIQWGPQIYRTWVLKRVGSLSIPMIILQAGGAALTAYFFSVTNPWYVFVPFIIASILLTVLLIECLYFLRQERLDAAEIVVESDSKQALINSS